MKNNLKFFIDDAGLEKININDIGKNKSNLINYFSIFLLSTSFLNLLIGMQVFSGCDNSYSHANENGHCNGHFNSVDLHGHCSNVIQSNVCGISCSGSFSQIINGQINNTYSNEYIHFNAPPISIGPGPGDGGDGGDGGGDNSGNDGDYWGDSSDDCKGDGPSDCGPV